MLIAFATARTYTLATKPSTDDTGAFHKTGWFDARPHGPAASDRQTWMLTEPTETWRKAASQKTSHTAVFRVIPPPRRNQDMSVGLQSPMRVDCGWKVAQTDDQRWRLTV